MTRILLIEDDQLNCTLLQECLESEGFHIISAEDGFKGLQQAREFLPDLILCDIIMPELDGYSVLLQLRQDPSTAFIPFIFLTAKTSKAEYRRGMELGADDYLTKPLTAHEVIAAVETRLERKAMLERCYFAKCQTILDPPSTQKTGQKEPVSIFPAVSIFNEVFDFIEANYNREITLSDVAQAVGYSPAYLTNRLKRETGRTVNRWIIERRMVEACSLLRNTDWSIEQIATTVGYLNVSYFFRQFRQYKGTTPKAWREQELQSTF
ncbi:two component transcriptional regulator, AraC family [Gloeothece citriformis PCC 7424]|uniref:Two component transcriptional regulator, AraC family n=1 Tax=Gloeothece citriformis (strain PCC 7424) TaxID=65393 RepID=B7KHJ4_GLOC7|nr:response regulator [Gloeothece citriformis]ACK70689.1 two component transcriptional regulator, AraC family [Gloeothece citriformis PCC 7424]